MLKSTRSVSGARPRRNTSFLPAASRRHLRTLVLALCLMLVAAPVLAIKPADPAQKRNGHLLHPVSTPGLQVRPDVSASAKLTPNMSAHAGVQSFVGAVGGQWQVRWDRRSNRPNVVQGSGVPVIPGRGNALKKADIGLAAGQPLTLDAVAAAVESFAASQQALLGTAGMDLRFDRDASAKLGSSGRHWDIRLAQYFQDVPVHDAYAYFRISNGNIVQFGTHRVAPVQVDPSPALQREEAFNAAWRQIPFRDGARLESVREPGQLLIMPIMADVQPLATRFNGMPGQGYGHRLVWRFVFKLHDDYSTYEVLMDAHSNELLQVHDINTYAQATVTGGVYPDNNAEPEIEVPLPFAAVSNNGQKTTDVDGHYDYSGGTASSALNGKYFRMSDNCGSISMTDDTDGNLAFGTSGGTDCTTPGYGGPGNTHASRTGFYHLTMINRIAKTYLPSNSWLDSKVTANMNINDVCNAYWNGYSLNFFKSGSGCSNTGELAGVFLHEWGHGLDGNTGNGSAPEMGSGEATGDTFAMLYTGDSCIGQNFSPGNFCLNCNTQCTGVRDLSAFAVHGPVGNVIAKPSTVRDPNGIAAPYSCPYYTPSGQPYQGPMGYEGHRESLIASSANWDLAQYLIEEYGEEQGWQKMNDIWYGAVTSIDSAYQVVSGGQCNTAAEVDGCAADNWYTSFLVADDDDGNLANGTPNACRIWDAYNAHGIACGTRPTCTGGAEPDFTIGTDTPKQSVCVPAEAAYTINIGARMGFSNPVTLAASDVPAGVSASFSVNPVTPEGSSELTLDTGTATGAGIYTIAIAGTAQDSPGHSMSVELGVTDSTPGGVTLQSPMDGAANVNTSPELNWNPLPDANTYTIEIATDASFNDIVDSASGLTATSYTTGSLDFNTTYYWRVTAGNMCGIGQPSAVFSFTTAQPNSYHILANLSGLQGDSVILQLNDTTPVTRSANGGFVFPSGVLDGQAYNIVVIDQPDNPKQTCNVENGSGSINGQNVSDVKIVCGDYVAGYTVGGTVTGLAGSGLVLQLNGSSNLSVSGSSFTFPNELPDGSDYVVTVLSQPESPAQVCGVVNGSGTINGANVADVVVACTDDTIFADGFEVTPASQLH